MNPYTGHLYALNEGESPFADYEVVPQELERAAGMKLNGKSDAHVSLTSGGKLSNWAANKRKAKIAASSKRKNRK